MNMLNRSTLNQIDCIVIRGKAMKIATYFLRAST